jgi:hypothetical protein
MSETADAPEARGNALMDMADVLLKAGDADAAGAALASAIEQFERKGMTVPAERARARLRSLADEEASEPNPVVPT